MRLLRAALAASLATAVFAAPASAATGRVLIPGATATKSSPVAALKFTLPPAFTQVRGAMEGTPAIGSYEVEHQPPGVPYCVVRVSLSALAAPSQPNVRRGIVSSAPPSRWLKPLRITRSGTHGGVRWWTGRMDFGLDDTALAGAASARIPAEIAPAGRRWAVVAAYVGHQSTNTPTAREACANFAYYDQRTAVREALASVRVVPVTTSRGRDLDPGRPLVVSRVIKQPRSAPVLV